LAALFFFRAHTSRDLIVLLLLQAGFIFAGKVAVFFYGEKKTIKGLIELSLSQNIFVFF
jgi:hypothetical protein